MSEKCETVKVNFDNEQGFVIINKSDMNESYSVYGEKAKDEPKEGSVAWIKSELKSLGVEFDDSDSKGDLKALLELSLEDQ